MHKFEPGLGIAIVLHVLQLKIAANSSMPKSQKRHLEQTMFAAATGHKSQTTLLGANFEQKCGHQARNESHAHSQP